jgi:oxygen-independent coproporphyrinogen-3 oxidase
MVLNLRLMEGCDLAAFAARWGAAALAGLESVLAPHLAAGRLVRTEGRLRLTRSGLLVANDIWSDLYVVPGDALPGRPGG